VRGNVGFVSLPTGSRKSLCYSLLLWSFRRSFVCNSTAIHQGNTRGNTPPPFSQFISCCLQYNRIEIACLPCDIKMTSRILNSSVSRKPVYSDQTFFSPSPARRERLARETKIIVTVINVVIILLVLQYMSSTSRAATLLHRRWVPLVQFVLAHSVCLAFYYI